MMEPAHLGVLHARRLPPVATIDRIIGAYAMLTDISIADLAGPSQTAAICLHRHQLMFLIRRMDHAASYGRIGGYLGGRDMATVHQAVAKMADAYDRDPRTNIELKRLEDLIKETISEEPPTELPPMPWQLLAGLSILRDIQLTDAEARVSALSLLQQLEASHGH